MKRPKAIKSNKVSEPEVEYITVPVIDKKVKIVPNKKSRKKVTKDKTVSEPEYIIKNKDFPLLDLFGIWKNSKFSLKKAREKTWGKRGK